MLWLTETHYDAMRSYDDMRFNPFMSWYGLCKCLQQGVTHPTWSAMRSRSSGDMAAMPDAAARAISGVIPGGSCCPAMRACARPSKRRQGKVHNGAQGCLM